ncbi:hypothetical protein EMPS_11062 [Entomortierella parvispora]|uniref:NACHT domain-containing protein n=1 Tax=Entomortierella parvispora TaxID=205924 RepID=A0A9P3HLI0_9FUNG|nr:hypothetical protein EMPS_11062 [Entomortierella parvispora]
MKKSTPPSSPSNDTSETKKKSRFSFFSSKKTTKPAKGGKEQAVAPIPSPPLSPPSVSKGKSTSSPSKIVQISTISQGIFPQNIPRVEYMSSMAKIGGRVEDTVQLVYSRDLLIKASTIGATPTPPMLSAAQLEWTQEMEGHPLEKEYLYQLTGQMINKFIAHPSKDTETIREIVLLSPVLDKEQYRSLMNCFLLEFQHNSLIKVELVRGMTQLIQSASIGYLKADDLVEILRIIRTRQQDHKLDEYLFYLTLAVSKVLNAMVDDKVEGLDRVHEHEPLLKLLSGLRNKQDPFLKFQALYAFQALQWVPNDETKLHCGLRHFAGVVSGVVKISGVIQMDFQGFLGGLKDIQQEVSDIYDFVSSGWEDAKTLIEDGKGLFDSVKNGLGLGRSRPWYITLRGAERLARTGHLADLNELISTAPCREDPLFLWGICQILGEIAIDPTWGKVTRSQAIQFLGEIYTSMEGSKTHQDVQRWVLTILQTLTDLRGNLAFSSPGDEEAVRGQARALLQKLDSERITAFPLLYPLRSQEPLPKSSALLKEVNDNPDLELVLDRLRRQCWNSYNRDAIYIQALAKSSLHASEDKAIPLRERATDFIKSKAEVLLILGDSGSGKSMFNKRLEYDLWNEYKAGGQIPLLIDLKIIERPDKDLIQQHLQHLGFSPEHIQELKLSQRPVILICDGYDECNQWVNIHTENHLNKKSHWMNVKLVISCRSQLLKPNYRSYFEPRAADRYNRAKTRTLELFEEAVIVPFEKEQIKEYIDQYTKAQQTESCGEQAVWTTDQYLEQLSKMPHLMDMVKNPFLLKLMLDTLPSISVSGQDLSAITRVQLYDEYVVQLLSLALDRLFDQRSKMSQAKLDAFEMVENRFVESGIRFSRKLADYIFKEHGRINGVEYPPAEDEGETWKDEFFGPKHEATILRESSPLVYRKKVYQFQHRSILEYFFSCLMFTPELTPLHGAESIRPYFGFAPSLSSDPSSIASHPFGLHDLVSEPSIIGFLAERVLQSTVFEAQLQDIIRLSKKDSRLSQAASNAITILVQAGVRFDEADLRGVQIPGADLSNGRFDSAQLQGANLTGVSLRGVWMRQANLSDAKMSDVHFGEWPYLQEETGTICCAYSPDEKACAVLLGNGIANIYDSSTWEKICTVQGYPGNITDLVYSPNSHQIALRSAEESVGLWNAQTGEPGPTLQGHPRSVVFLMYSPSGHAVATASLDCTVRLWDPLTGNCFATLSGHEAPVSSIVFSLDGQRIVTSSEDKTLRLWDAQTNELVAVLSGHTDRVLCAAFSPDSQQLVSGSEDQTLRLWNGQTGAPGSVLKGHSSLVTLAMFSPDGQQILSGSKDDTLRLWNAQTGTPVSVLTGHTDAVTCMAYCGEQIASGSVDKTVRLWDAQTGAPGAVLNGHSRGITRVVYSPVSQRITSTSWDQTVRMWDVQHGVVHAVNSCHTASVTSVIYSPDGQQVASGSSDQTVRLWNAQTGAPGPVLSGHSAPISNVVFSPDGEQVASSSWDTTIRLWDAKSGTSGPVLSGHEGPVTSVVFSPVGHQLASSSWDSTVRLWNSKTGESGHVLSGHAPYTFITCLAYSSNGQHVVSGGVDSTVRVWDTQSGTPEHVLSGHDSAITSVVFSPNGQWIASSSEDKTVRLWDAITGVPGPVLTGHTDFVQRVVYSPDGTQLASISLDKTLRLWDAHTGEASHVMNGHESDPMIHAYSPDGLQIASGGADNTVRLWDVKSGQSLSVIESFHGPVNAIAWKSSPNGTYFATGSEDNSVCVWQAVKKNSQQEDHPHVRLRWSRAENALVLTNASIEGVQGLSASNLQLLRQRGADGAPAEAGKE